MKGNFHAQEELPFMDEREKYWCVYCGNKTDERKTNWDHVPSKCLLSHPLPADLPIIEVCSACNSGFSQNEEYFRTFLSCVLSGSFKPQDQPNERVQNALKGNKKLRSRMARSRLLEIDPDGSERVFWRPELQPIEDVVVKNARGHLYFEETKPEFRPPEYVRIVPLINMSDSERSDFEVVGSSELWPEIGSRAMMYSVDSWESVNDWVVVQEGNYRYRIVRDGSSCVRSVISEYLATEVCWE
jgi:hypothetical protein